MTNPVLCIHCGEPIVFGQLFRMIQDESGRATYSHVMRVGDEFVPGCPQPDPVAESGEEEEPATEGPASLQVNTSAELPSARERTAGDDRAARSVVGAPPSSKLDRGLLARISYRWQYATWGITQDEIGHLRGMLPAVVDALDRGAEVQKAGEQLALALWGRQVSAATQVAMDVVMGRMEPAEDHQA